MSNRASKQRCEQAAREAVRFEATGDLVVVIGDLADHVDPDSGLVLHLSPAWERVFERPVAALVGQPFRAFLGDSGSSLWNEQARSRIHFSQNPFCSNTPTRTRVRECSRATRIAPSKTPEAPW